KLGRLEKAFEKVLISAQEKGELNKEKDPVAISRFLGSTMKGLRITCKETQDKEFIGSIINTALTVLEN
ncbi:MAG: TetR/AcrR family transcriptional regulator, partial [Deltaproteobacteria bacterium]|nr:TetR/AcrR family transcriptional regulator [Deltaproteobacteria bacterium]